MARRRFDPQRDWFWREVLARYRASGLSVRVFCAEAGLSEPSFYAWRRTIARRDGTSQDTPSVGKTIAGSETVRRVPRGKRSAGPQPDFVPLKLRGEVRSPVLSGMAIEVLHCNSYRMPELGGSSLNADSTVVSQIRCPASTEILKQLGPGLHASPNNDLLERRSEITASRSMLGDHVYLARCTSVECWPEPLVEFFT